VPFPQRVALPTQTEVTLPFLPDQRFHRQTGSVGLKSGFAWLTGLPRIIQTPRRTAAGQGP
jgi:hypothetical protein